MPSTTWDADQYAKFIDERTRPAIELLRRVELTDPTHIYDLGCGPGNSTAILKERWPQARVVGADSSSQMLDMARKDHPGIEFAEGDIVSWQPDAPADLIFSNAAYQWVPEHDKLFPRLVSYLKPGGVLAMQVPHNHEKMTHVSMRTVATENKWSVDLSDIRYIRPVLEAQQYYDVLCADATNIDIWETEYFHVMSSIEAIVEWLKGTGLRPFIEALAVNERAEYLRLYADELRKHIRTQADGKVLLPFPRLFVVARKK
jgi:trans-aconitate 2-methyltransferase